MYPAIAARSRCAVLPLWLGAPESGRSVRFDVIFCWLAAERLLPGRRIGTISCQEFSLWLPLSLPLASFVGATCRRRKLIRTPGLGRRACRRQLRAVGARTTRTTPGNAPAPSCQPQARPSRTAVPETLCRLGTRRPSATLLPPAAPRRPAVSRPMELWRRLGPQQPGRFNRRTSHLPVRRKPHSRRLPRRFQHSRQRQRRSEPACDLGALCQQHTKCRLLPRPNRRRSEPAWTSSGYRSTTPRR